MGTKGYDINAGGGGAGVSVDGGGGGGGFVPGPGVDRIMDFEDGVDTILLKGYASVSIRTAGGHAVIQAGSDVDIIVHDAAGPLDMGDLVKA